MEFETRVKNMLLGVALGDALGVPHEFRRSKYKYTGKLEFPGELYNRFTKITLKTQVGQVSDDTEMSLILYHLIRKKVGIEEKVENIPNFREEVIKRYLEWANNETSKQMGSNTRKLFKGIKTLRGFDNRWKKMDFSEVQSNGALMRSAILFLLPDQYFEIDCRLTNDNPICIEVEKLYLNIIRDIFAGKKKKEIWGNLLERIEKIEEPHKDLILETAIKAKRKEEFPSSFSVTIITSAQSRSISIINLGFFKSTPPSYRLLVSNLPEVVQFL